MGHPNPDSEAFLQATRQVLVQLPGLIIVKDLQSRILAINDPLAQLIGLRRGTEALGRYEFELARCLEGAGAEFLQQDAATLQLGRQRFVDVLTYADGVPRAILSEKVCIRDPRGAPCALLFQGTDVSGQLFGRVSALLAAHVGRARQGATLPVSYSLDTPHIRVRHLPPRAAECLFFLLRGQTARGIAEKLHLSPRTVEDYLDQLKGIFDCATKAQVIEQAINEGYGNYLPDSLLKTA